METVRVMLPVVLMLAIGFICKKVSFFTDEGMETIRKYIVFIALPTTIFHAMAVAELNRETIFIVVVMFLVLVIAMLLGFLLRPLIPEPYRNYLPFLITVFEGGMFAYPLYQNLCGEEQLVNIVIVDIAGCIFGFGVYYGILALVDRKQKFSIKALAGTAAKSPTFWAVVLGLIVNATGIMKYFLASSVGDTYLAIKNLIVAPLTALILLYVGYTLKIDKKICAVCIKTIAFRMVVMAGLCILVLNILRVDMKDHYMLSAFLVYFICPPTFSLPGFVKNRDAAGYFAMTTSMYVLITMVGYAIITALLF